MEELVTKLGISPLQKAIRAGNTSRALALIHGGADVDETEKRWGCTAMHYAAMYNNVEVATQLLEVGGANVNQQDDSGWTPLMYAVREESVDIVDFLLSNEASLLCCDKLMGDSALHLAVKNSNSSIVYQLLLHRENILDESKELEDWVNEKRHTDGNSPLMLAAMMNNLCAVRQIVQAGAEVNQTNIYGLRAIDFSVRGSGCSKDLVFKYLLACGSQAAV